VKTYILKRLLLMIPTLIGVTMVVFFIVRLAPGDPIEAMIRNQSGNIDPKAMKESADKIRERLGLIDYHFLRDRFFGPEKSWAEKPAGAWFWCVDAADKVASAAVGYWNWGRRLVVGDFGESIKFRMSRSSPIIGYLTDLQSWLWGVDVVKVEKSLKGVGSPQEKTRTEAVEELRRLAGKDFGSDAKAWQEWWTGFTQARPLSGWAQGMTELRANGSKNPFWIILDRIAVTATLNIIAEIFIFVIAIPVGFAAARYQGRWFDRVSSFVLLALYSIPVILAGTVFLGYLGKGGSGWQLFPVGNLHSFGYEKLAWGPYLADLLWHTTLPVICLVYGGFAYLAKMGRASLLENLRADYVRTARAKGLPEEQVVYRHALRNSLLPMITALVLAIPGLIGGSVIVETIFSIQGTGLLLVDAAKCYDLALLMAETLLYGVMTLLFLLIGDILYAWADPRVRYE
jgi:ABC-type dipeptide/oligopeptide/nickel transport system permease component